MLDIYQNQWEFLDNKLKSRQLSHAYLFIGLDGEKKNKFARKFIQYINCQSYKNNDRQFCKAHNAKELCQNCNLIENNNFPDLLTVASFQSESSLKKGKDMMEIDIAQVRGINKFLAYKPYYGKIKSVIVEDADRMNQEAQNCFLKTLEEPKGNALIILIASKTDMILPTIASRCQAVPLLGKKDASRARLKHPPGIVEITKADLAEKFRHAKKMDTEGQDLQETLLSMQSYFRDELLLKAGFYQESSSGIANKDNKDYPIGKLKKILRLLEDILYQLSRYDINPRLALEMLLLEI